MPLLLLLVAALAVASCAGGDNATPSNLEPDTTTLDPITPTDMRALEMKVDYLVKQASITSDQREQAFLTPDELRGIVFPIPSGDQPLEGDDLIVASLNGASQEGLSTLPRWTTH
jgi:hypothetical protein